MAGVQLAFTLDGRTLAIGGGTEGKIIFWSVATAQEILGFDSEIVPIKALAFSPDGGALVAAGGWDLDAAHQSKLLIWRAKPGPTEMNSAHSIVTR
jgi:WD40 repeat protein